MELPDGTELPDETELTDELELPDETELMGELELPDETELMDVLELPDETALMDETALTVKTDLPSNGINGRNGTDGRDGRSMSGRPGADGKPGTNGKNGVDGKSGTDGRNGLNGKDAEVKFIDVKVPICKCEQNSKGEWEPKKEEATVKAIANKDGSGSNSVTIIQEYKELFKSNSELCLAKNKDDNCVAGIPLAWQLRPEGDRSQLIIQCGEVDDKGKIGSPMYPITIPHYGGTKLKKSPVPEYIKGNYEYILVLADNSKITINAKNKKEAEKVINAIKLLIKPDFISKSYSKSGLIKNNKFQIKETKVKPKMAKYFSKGQKQAKPDWIVKF